MKYEQPIMEVILMEVNDIVTLSGTEGDGTEFDPNALNLYSGWGSE